MEGKIKSEQYRWKSLLLNKFPFNGQTYDFFFFFFFVYSKVRLTLYAKMSIVIKRSCSTTFIWMIAPQDLMHILKSFNYLVQLCKQHHRKALPNGFHLNCHTADKQQQNKALLNTCFHLNYKTKGFTCWFSERDHPEPLCVSARNVTRSQILGRRTCLTVVWSRHASHNASVQNYLFLNWQGICFRFLCLFVCLFAGVARRLRQFQSPKACFFSFAYFSSVFLYTEIQIKQALTPLYSKLFVYKWLYTEYEKE